MISSGALHGRSPAAGRIERDDHQGGRERSSHWLHRRQVCTGCCADRCGCSGEAPGLRAVEGGGGLPRARLGLGRGRQRLPRRLPAVPRPTKPGIEKTIGAMGKHGISVRIVSGDNRHVSARMAAVIGLPEGEVLTGEALAGLDDEALAARIAGVQVFAEVEPQQKDRIVRAFQKAGHAVGYMGDGINDAPALRAADVGISVDSAVDVARESADIVLLRPDLRQSCTASRMQADFRQYAQICRDHDQCQFRQYGEHGRGRPAAALPAAFAGTDPAQQLPLRPASRGDCQRFCRPRAPCRASALEHRADSQFHAGLWAGEHRFRPDDFAFLHFVVHAGPETFRTTWFVLSLLTELVALLVLRTRRRFWRSKPSHLLLWSSVFVAIVALCLPYSGAIARSSPSRPYRAN